MSWPWSSLDKKESLVCQKNSPCNNELGCFKNKIEKIALQNNLFLNGEVV